MTAITESFFALLLPGEWKEIKTGKPMLWQYQSQAGSEQLTVSVVQYHKQLFPRDIEPHLEQYLQVRRKAEVDAARGASLEVTPVAILQQGGGVAASYSGFHPPISRRFLNFTIGNTKVVVTFYYEALDMTVADFDRRKREVIGSVSVAG
jgi:hypothetical protein